MAENGHADLVGQVQALTVLLQLVHHPERLLVVAEGDAHDLAEGHFSGVAEGGVAQIVAQGRGFHQILVEPESPGNGAGNAADLQGVGHAGAVVVALGLEKHLGLVHQPPEGFGVDNAVGIPLVAGAHVALLFPVGASLSLGGLLRPGREQRVFLLLQEFSYGHTITLPHMALFYYTRKSVAKD